MTEVQWVQLTIPSVSSALLAQACQRSMNEAKSDAEYNILENLRDFFAHAAENPRAFTPSGAMATRLKMRARRVRGVRRNDGSLKDGTPRVKGRRRTRAERRAREAKERRQHRAETVAAFNTARNAIEHELSTVEGHRLLPVTERLRRLAGGGSRRAEGQDPDAHVPSQ